MTDDPRSILDFLASTGGRMRAEVIAVAGSYARPVTAELIETVLAGQFVTLRASLARADRVSGQRTLPRLERAPARLVLELELQAAADLDAVLERLTPSIVVLTGFDSQSTTSGLETLYADLARAISANGAILVNVDDPILAKLALPEARNVMRFGLGADTDLRAAGPNSHGLEGIEFDLVLARSRQAVRVNLPWVGRGALHAALAAAAVTLTSGRDLASAGAALQSSSSTTRILVEAGLNDSQLLDDTSNASPESGLQMLNLLSRLDGRKIAVLGDMLGLADQEEVGHRKVGNRAALVVNELVTIGSRARLIAEEAISAGLPAPSVHQAEDSNGAAAHLRALLVPGDVALFKAAPELQLKDLVKTLRAES